MSKVVIAIHGLGNKPDKDTLEYWWLTSIKEGLKGIGQYIFPAGFEMVYWADILYEKPLDIAINDKDNPLYLEEKYTPAPVNYKPSPHSLRKKVLDVLEKQMDKVLLNGDHFPGFDQITEMIIHKYFRDLEIYYDKTSAGKDTPRDLIRNRLYKVLQKYKKHEIMLIGHSMGSIVAYDVLSILKPEINISTLVTMGSPLGLPVVMNKISAELGLKINETNKLTTPPGVLNNWFNFSDLEDKVAMNYNLADDYDPSPRGVSPRDFIVNNNYTINEVNNPHKSYGYLRTPEFANVLCNFLMTNKSGKPKWLYSLYNKVYRRFF